MDDPLLFSWSDSIRAAFVSCLPCLHPNHRGDPGSGEGEASQQLQGLLADASTDTETEETLSLHSRHDPRRRRRKTFPKRITIFGYNLFGRRPPAIQLPPDGEDDEGLTVGRGRRARVRLDSDAAPLDASAISALASTGDLEQEQEHDERRRKRRERKELKRAAAALALQSQEDFEGFPGTGSNSRPGIPSPFQHHSPAHTNSNSQRNLRDTFARQPSPHDDEDDDADLGGELYSRRSRPSRGDDEEEDGADLGGELYARRTTTSGNSGSRGSDSQSRTSANSQSQSGLTGTSAHYHHHHHRNYTTNGQPQPQPSPHMDDALGHFGPKRKKKKSTRKSSKTSNSTASQSPSLPSPTQLGFPQSYNNNNPEITDVQLEGFSGGGGGGDSGIGFPSTGFGRRESGKRDMAMGAFLARVGDV